MEKIKRYWKEILLGLFVLFVMNKCVQSCNRQGTIDKQTKEIMHKDSVIQEKTDSLNIMTIRWNDAQANQSTYQGIAIGNQQELFKQINELTAEKETLIKRVNSLTFENSKLKKEISKLKQNN